MGEISKVIINNDTLIDLTNDSIDSSIIPEGISAHNKAGELITGEYVSLADGLGSLMMSSTTINRTIAAGERFDTYFQQEYNEANALGNGYVRAILSNLHALSSETVTDVTDLVVWEYRPCGDYYNSTYERQIIMHFISIWNPTDEDIYCKCIRFSFPTVRYGHIIPQFNRYKDRHV